MADNVTLDIMSGGDSVAADDIAGIKFQRMKLIHGADGINDGDVSTANPLPIRLYFGTVAASVGAGAVGTGVQRVTHASDDPVVTSLQLLDNSVDGNYLNVNLNIAGTDVAAGSGASGATTQRVIASTDSPEVTSLGIMDDWDNTASDGASVSGDVAHDGVDAGEPVKIGGKATASLSGETMVAANDRTNARFGIDGVQIIRPHTNLEDIVTGNASNTDGTSTQCIAAQAAGIKTYLTSIVLTNMSATNIYVEIKDGTTVKMTIPVPANSGAIVPLPVPIPGTAATAWNFDPSAAATTIYCSMVGFKSKV